MADADTTTRNLLLQMSADPKCVFLDKHATGNMLAWNLTQTDIQDAIFDCISKGGRVKLTTIKSHPAQLVGQPAYELKQMINGQRFYIRMTVFQPEPAEQALLIVSVHPDV